MLKAAVPKDLSYVFGGAYSPFLVKLVELVRTYRETFTAQNFSLRFFSVNVTKSARLLFLCGDFSVQYIELTNHCSEGF